MVLFNVKLAVVSYVIDQLMVLFNVKLAVVSYVIDQLTVLFNVKLAVVSYVCCNIFMNIMRLSTCTFYIKQEIAILLDFIYNYYLNK
jgi:hypothetical protein